MTHSFSPVSNSGRISHLTRCYITGGIGSTRLGEAFTYAYDLPNDQAYTETCASIGLVFFGHRMLRIHPNASYADVMERALYNVFLEEIKTKKPEINKCYQCIKTCDCIHTPYCISRALVNAVKGDIDHGLVFCGASTYKAVHMETVPEIIEDLLPGSTLSH